MLCLCNNNNNINHNNNNECTKNANPHDLHERWVFPSCINQFRFWLYSK